MKRSLWIGRLSLYTGIQGRGSNDYGPTWLGFSYGSWLPVVRLNDGWSGKGLVKDVGWHWLCFHGSITWWGNATRGNWGLL
jgi:hypothetical protein